MPREKEFFRDVVADIVEVTGKRILGVNDIRGYLHIGYSKAVKYLEGGQTITAFQLARKLI